MFFKRNNLIKYIVKVEGMRCKHCEAHVNEAIKNNFKVVHVESSNEKKATLIQAKEELNELDVKKVINEAGYEFISMEKIA